MNWKILLSLMILFAVMMAASYTMLIPFLPVYLTQELGATADNVNLWSGVIFAVTFAISAFVAPIWGRMSDKTGRKLMMLRSSVLLALTYFLGGLVESPFQLFLVRVLQGFAAGLWPACLAMMSAYVPRNKIGIAMGLMQSANICGGIIGPLLGGLLATGVGMRNSFFVGAAALSLITVITIFCVKEPPRQKQTAAVPDPKKSGNRAMLHDKGILALLCAAGLTNMVIMEMQPIMTVYINELLADSTQNLVLISGMVFSLGGLAGAIASPIWGRTGQKIGFHTTMVAALLIAGVLIAVQGVPRDLRIFAAMQFCAGLGFSGIFPSANSLLILATPPENRGSGFGMLFAAQQVGGAAGPILGGIIATLLPLNTVFFAGGGTLFLIGLWMRFFAPASLKVKPSDKPVTEDAEYYQKLREQILKEMRQKKEG